VGIGVVMWGGAGKGCDVGIGVVMWGGAGKGCDVGIGVVMWGGAEIAVGDLQQSQ
jgi:hypothetical protein